MNIQIVSRAGKCHDFDPQKNEDAVSSLVGERYAFFCISDGAGSSQYAKDAAWTTVNTVMKCCEKYGSDFFKKNKKLVQKRLIIDIQRSLKQKSDESKTTLSNMMSTLVLLGIDLHTKEYFTVHVGDGLITKKTPQSMGVISYPENGVTKSYTYFINSKRVFSHLKCTCGSFEQETIFFLCSDGVMENCCTTCDYLKRAYEQQHNHSKDDCSYCVIYT